MNAASDPATPSTVPAGLGVRTISAVVLAAPVLAAEIVGPPWFTVLIVLTAAVMAWEWSKMCGMRPAWLFAGMFYIAVPAGALIWLRGADDAGMYTILWLFAVVWSADIGAYLCGRSIGGPKLAPRISPKKTWSGFIGGISAAAAASAGFAWHWDGNIATLILVGLTVAIASQAGDLVESAVKRHFGVKDSSTLIPGHGGVLDRVDALIVGALMLALILLIWGRELMPWA